MPSPSRIQFQNRALARSGENRTEHRPVFDSLLIAAAAQPNPSFFFSPIGGGNEYQTSMRTPGQLSGSNTYAVGAVRVIPEPVVTDDIPADLAQLIRSFFVLEVNGTRVAQFHAFDLPGGAGLHIFSEQGGEVAAGNLTAVTVANNGIPDIRARRILAAPFGLEPSEQFFGRLTFAAVPAMAAARRLFVQLDGEELRPRI